MRKKQVVETEPVVAPESAVPAIVSSILPDSVIRIITNPKMERAAAGLVRTAEDMQGMTGEQKKAYVVEKLAEVAKIQFRDVVDRTILHLLNELGVVAMKHQRGTID